MTKKPFSNQIALITGASRGIGAALAKQLASHGAHVIVTARTESGLISVHDDIVANGGTATILPLDLMKLPDIDKLGPSIAARFGKLDILVGNAGVLGALSPVALSENSLFDKMMTVNVYANYRLIKTLDPLLRAAPKGQAFFLTSAAAHKDRPFWGLYAASKAALEKMVLAYALEVAQSNLRVNLIDPSATATAMRRDAYPGEDQSKLPSADDCAQNIISLMLASPSTHAAILKVA